MEFGEAHRQANYQEKETPDWIQDIFEGKEKIFLHEQYALTVTDIERPCTPQEIGIMADKTQYWTSKNGSPRHAFDLEHGLLGILTENGPKFVKLKEKASILESYKNYRESK